MLMDYYSIVLQFHIPARNSGEKVDQKMTYIIIFLIVVMIVREVTMTRKH